MILAAGRGERMGALTKSTPKPLLKVAGKPLLAHHIEKLVAAGLTDIVINTSYLGEQIRQFVKGGAQFGASIQCTTEAERLETGGGIFNALPLLGDEPFLLVNGDVWSNFDYSCLRLRVENGLLQGLHAHLVLVPNPAHHPEGDFGLQAETGKVCCEAEKNYTFSGISVMTSDLFRDCQAGRFTLAPLLRREMAAGKVSGELFEGFWADVGTPRRLQEVEHIIQEQN